MQLSTTLVHRRDVTIKPPTPRAHGTQVSYPLWPLVQRTPCYDDAAQQHRCQEVSPLATWPQSHH